MSSDDQEQDIDEQLHEIAERMDDLRRIGHDRSAIQTAKELRRRARQFQRSFRTCMRTSIS
jgi:transcriptional regulator GlxA family with amidase domain